MPDLPDIPGKSVITSTTKRARVVVAGVGAGAVAASGFVLKRVLSSGDGDKSAEDGAVADKVSPIPKPAPPTEPPPVAKKPKPAPSPKPASPAAEPKAA